jgi:radical SAM protein with 4Fe4S-binding SPASM domain
LLEKIDELSEVDVITLSTFQDDPEWEEQYSIIKKFMELSKVRVVIRCLGNIGEERMSLYKKLNTTIVSRILHSPMGSFDYERKTTIPEHGICLEMLNHPAIDVDGNLSMCVRFDPDKIGVLGNLNDESLYNIWNSEKRKKLLSLHVDGKRGEMSFCNKCDFYGIPRGV